VSARFSIPYLLTVRPARGSDRALLVENGPQHYVGRCWDGSGPAGVSDPLPFTVGLDSILTSDGRWVVGLDDDGGSEVGRLVARSVADGGRVELTPELGPYVLRGLDVSADGGTLVATIVDDDGFHVEVLHAAPWGPARRVFSSPDEAWWGRGSADGSLVVVDTTDHNPGVRRPAATVVDVASAAVVAVLDDMPLGPVRSVCFAREPGDPRVLVSTERSGFARPCIWNPMTGERADFSLDALEGEVVALDWHSRSGVVLAVHVDGGVHRLLRCDEATGTATVVAEGIGSVFEPDVADAHDRIAASYLRPDGSIAVVSTTFAEPRRVSLLGHDGALHALLPPAPVPGGHQLASVQVESRDGTTVQMWVGRPAGAVRGTVLEVHGGPNLATVDAYEPWAQEWLDAGFAYASLNYRGSVTFGRTFREGFWGCASDRELEDIEAAVAWLRGEGLADPATSFITGASYGGHLTLLAMGRLPGRFAGGLAHIAMADWLAAWDDMNPALQRAWAGFLGGTPQEVPEVWSQRSAVNFVDRVVGSVWLNQGTRDTRTPAGQAQRYVERLRAHGGDVLIDWFDAGHGAPGLESAAESFDRMLELVERTLRGRRWSDPAG
jgi:dienelactone hydrolase